MPVDQVELLEARLTVYDALLRLDLIIKELDELFCFALEEWDRLFDFGERK